MVQAALPVADSGAAPYPAILQQPCQAFVLGVVGAEDHRLFVLLEDAFQLRERTIQVRAESIAHHAGEFDRLRRVRRAGTGEDQPPAVGANLFDFLRGGEPLFAVEAVVDIRRALPQPLGLDDDQPGILGEVCEQVFLLSNAARRRQGDDPAGLHALRR